MRSSKAKISNVGLFVDWNAQLRQAPPEYENDPIEKCRFSLKAMGKSTTKFLTSLEADCIYRVRTRLYHGWTTGVTHTVNRRAFSKLSEIENPDDIFPSTKIVSLTDIEFGDRLIDALTVRENKGLRIHLPNTLRKQSGQSIYTEKMVDSALAADLLSWARLEPSSIAIVLSPDDDMVPPTFVAEAWMKPHGGLVRLVRPTPRAESRFLALKGLVS